MCLLYAVYVCFFVGGWVRVKSIVLVQLVVVQLCPWSVCCEHNCNMFGRKEFVCHISSVWLIFMATYQWKAMNCWKDVCLHPLNAWNLELYLSKIRAMRAIYVLNFNKSRGVVHLCDVLMFVQADLVC